jgi:hypothetical protein
MGKSMTTRTTITTTTKTTTTAAMVYSTWPRITMILQTTTTMTFQNMSPLFVMEILDGPRHKNYQLCLVMLKEPNDNLK